MFAVGLGFWFNNGIMMFLFPWDQDEGLGSHRYDAICIERIHRDWRFKGLKALNPPGYKDGIRFACNWVPNY